MRPLPLLLAALTLLSACGATPTQPPRPMPFNTMGREDAPVSIIEFTDLQCPYCGRHAREVFPRIKSDYIDTGKVRYASRDLPLAIHPFALPAAVASRCAGEQGRFWEYREALFADQRALGTEPYARIAGELGLDVERLEACRRDGRQEQEVLSDVEVARASGIRSTPAFLIGRVVDGQFQGERVTGLRTYEAFAERIDAQLQPAGR
jgi:protein-disulfide isomerase